jgi:hypothetical protein
MYKSIPDLIRKFGKNKHIPHRYEAAILDALSHYPELKDTNIHFKLVNKSSVPYGTTPSFASVFKPSKKRYFTITLLEKANGPEFHALFKNLSYQKQVAVIAHELVHVIQFSNCSRFGLLKTLVKYPFPSFKKKVERGADLGAIEHGFGKGLYELAVYLRNIPGYLEKRPEIDKYYLKPDEILERLTTKYFPEPEG